MKKIIFGMFATSLLTCSVYAGSEKKHVQNTSLKNRHVIRQIVPAIAILQIVYAISN